MNRLRLALTWLFSSKVELVVISVATLWIFGSLLVSIGEQRPAFTVDIGSAATGLALLMIWTRLGYLISTIR